MTDKLLELIRQKHRLTSVECGEFASLKASGMKFSVSAYRAEGLGHVSLMRAKGFLGLMRMDTLMIVPEDTDLPLYSYDRIYAMSKDTLIVELYDTLTAPTDLSALDAAKQKHSALPERDAGEHWYDSIKLSQSISKKGKKSHTPALDALASEHFAAYLDTPATKTADTDKKRELTLAYVGGLLKYGGPSTDVFKKELGENTTERLFKEVLFGVK